ncbi:hypothetical protein SNEBB_001552 [Seison nebaliae]|nr:hypothetical protein SNEBB_001552 [Seison nebaliae]
MIHRILLTFALILQIFTKKIEINTDANRLYNDLMESYDPIVRPVENATDILTVKIGLRLFQLVDIDEKHQIMSTNVWLKHEWIDHKLKWIPSSYGNISHMYLPSDKIWKPDVVLYNNADGSYVVTTKTKATVYNTGKIIWEPPVIYKSYCQIRVEYFPFDEQDCYMKFGTWSYDGQAIDLQHISNTGEDDNHTVKLGWDLSEYYPNVEWDVMSIPAARYVKKYECCSELYIDIKFNITLRRKTLFHTVNLIVPCLCISFLSLFVFYLPSDSGEKMTLSLSILVSLTVFFLLLIDIIPPTSIVVPLMGKYLTFTTVLIILSISLTVVVLNLNYRPTSSLEMPPWLRHVFIDILPKYLWITRPSDVRSAVDSKTAATRHLFFDDGFDYALHHNVENDLFDNAIMEDHLRNISPNSINVQLGNNGHLQQSSWNRMVSVYAPLTTDMPYSPYNQKQQLQQQQQPPPPQQTKQLLGNINKSHRMKSSKQTNSLQREPGKKYYTLEKKKYYTNSNMPQDNSIPFFFNNTNLSNNNNNNLIKNSSRNNNNNNNINPNNQMNKITGNKLNNNNSSNNNNNNNKMKEKNVDDQINYQYHHHYAIPSDSIFPSSVDNTYATFDHFERPNDQMTTYLNNRMKDKCSSHLSINQRNSVKDNIKNIRSSSAGKRHRYKNSRRHRIEMSYDDFEETGYVTLDSGIRSTKYSNNELINSQPNGIKNNMISAKRAYTYQPLKTSISSRHIIDENVIDDLTHFSGRKMKNRQKYEKPCRSHKYKQRQHTVPSRQQSLKTIVPTESFYDEESLKPKSSKLTLSEDAGERLIRLKQAAADSLKKYHSPPKKYFGRSNRPRPNRPIHPEVLNALESLNFVTKHMQEEDEDRQALEDWKYVGLVLDRLFMVIFSTVCVVGTISIIAAAPSLYDDREPIDVKLSKMVGSSNH